ncbi:esterase [Corynebacterium doosanense CAU 212 = DSM 45436]|uniref:Esterase n=2 Tax=Corynebacterium TaxID=1716 RepID=A0A097IDJ8_9CORY|nr:alpha/beta hydrolase family protein [Corynebacterium doosanense]AIT60194.1 esterase [Corynebacterium doosanense CAU 212 = DSM 45436]
MHTFAAPAAALALALCATSTAVAPVATAQTQTAAVSPLTTAPLRPNGEAQKWFGIAQGDDRVEAVSVHSTAMNRDIPLALIPATDGKGDRVENAPTIYMLNGSGGAEQNNDWLSDNPTTADNVGTIDFYSDKGVNVVIPMAGAYSYYLDWVEQPNGAYLQGPQNWETFLVDELPGAIEPHLKAGDKRGIIGFSMSALPAMLLAEHNPGMYDAVAGFSGHYQTFSEVDHQVHGATLQRGGATPTQMLGPAGSPASARADAVINAEGLRGTAIYASNGSGLASESDQFSYHASRGVDPATAAYGVAGLQVTGGAIEAVTNVSTHNLDAKLQSLGIPATFNYRDTGTHSWPSWHSDVHESWPVFQTALFG